MNSSNEARFDLVSTKDGHEVKVYNPKDIGFRMFTISKPSATIDTEVTVFELNPDVDIAAVIGWLGATQSRINGDIPEVLKKIHDEAKKDSKYAAAKIGKVYANYGHASVGDLVSTSLHMTKLPLESVAKLFHLDSTTISAGQATSTRYITFDDLGITPLELLVPEIQELDSKTQMELKSEWQSIQDYMEQKYGEWYKRVLTNYKTLFPKGEKPKIKKSTYKSRALDIARLWIPSGASTSMSLALTVRSTIATVRRLRESPDIQEQELGDLILKAIELGNDPDIDINQNFEALTKYSDATNTINDNLDALSEFLEKDDSFQEILHNHPSPTSPQGLSSEVYMVDEFDNLTIPEKIGTELFMHYIMALHPNLTEAEIVNWIRTKSDQDLEQISEIIFKDHTHHDHFGNMGDVRGCATFSITTSFAYIRDLNRHQAFGRFTPFHFSKNVEALLESGYQIPDQFQSDSLLAIDESIIDDWKSEMDVLYSRVIDLNGRVKTLIPEANPIFIKRLIPFAHRVKMLMSGSLKQIDYMTNLRTKKGGDIGYVKVAEDIIKVIKESDTPHLKGLSRIIEDPYDLDSREHLAERS